MSSISQPDSNGQSPQGIWPSIVPYIAPPIAASVAIIPVFYGFIAKSAQQVGDPIPRMSFKAVLKEGIKAAPTVGVIVGTQMIAQTAVENVIKTLMNESQTSTIAPMIASSIIVGAVSAPALAVFNGQTMRQTVKESISSLCASPKQAGAIIVKEVSFLFSQRMSEPVGEFMKATCGDNKAVEYGSAFVSGAIGSVVGHPADTALTLWQKGLQVESFSKTMRGAPIKALALGGFSVCYKAVKELF